MGPIEIKFISTPEKGEVSALLLRPDNATHLLVLAHGAGSNMGSPMLARIADALAEAGIATFRFNFPYSEHGKARDANSVCAATARSACAAALAVASDLNLLAGGHSFGGRMTSTAASQEALEGVRGLVFFSFPLHPPGRPGVERADHLFNVEVPMLFLTGTRDEFATGDLLPQTVSKLGKRATLHLVHTADHGFKVLKRSRESKEDVFVELARVVRAWAGSRQKIGGQARP
jgi:predicted alpha/beta-hydrolase family hydrolase